MPEWTRKASEKIERAKILMKELLPLLVEIRDKKEEVDEELEELLIDLEETVD